MQERNRELSMVAPIVYCVNEEGFLKKECHFDKKNKVGNHYKWRGMDEY